MKVFTKLVVYGAVTIMLAGAAAAADMPYATSGGYAAGPHYGTGAHHRFRGYRHHARHRSLIGLGHHSSAYGRAKQRHRTHLDRCNNVPSRC